MYKKRNNLLVKVLALLILCMDSLVIHAGWAKAYNDQIQSLRIEANSDWLLPPIIKLNSKDYITLSFDEMSHEYHRFTYKIIHCDAFWNKSNIHESDYLQGFNGQPIDDYSNSLNTTFEYTHYKITFPNNDITLKISGNYEIEISENDRIVAEARFAVIEPLSVVGANVSSNTDIDTNNKHQQIEFSVSYPGISVRDPEKELIEVVIQNRRIDEMVTNLKPSHLMNGQIRFTNNRQLLFPAGNEFRRFEIINMYDYLQNVDKVSFFDPYFHATLLTDKKRINYSYDQDHNGRYITRYSQSDNNDTEADYLFVHFTYSSPKLSGGDLFISSDFTQRELSNKWKMSYNEAIKSYELTALLKQGSYDYQYLWVPYGETKGQTSVAEGDFYETKNEYLILIYYRQTGSRYDRLIGMSNIDTSNQ